MALPSEKVFGALKEEYIDLVNELKKRYKRLTLFDRCVKLRSREKVKVVAKSENR